MVLKIPPPPQLTSPELQIVNRWLIEIQNLLNGEGALDTTAVTQPPGTNDNTIATTAFVLANTPSNPSNAVPPMDGAGTAGVSALYSRGDHQHPTDTTRAPLASPGFTGNPTAPTQAVNDNSTKLATTAFVETQISSALSSTPLVRNGSGAPAGALGNVSDWYADTTNKHIYVKTASATWTLIA